jgi:uncharacterized membrane protein YjgN (DUF898 family)
VLVVLAIAAVLVVLAIAAVLVVLVIAAVLVVTGVSIIGNSSISANVINTRSCIMVVAVLGTYKSSTMIN